MASHPRLARLTAALTTPLLVVAWTAVTPLPAAADVPADVPDSSEPSVKGPFLNAPPTVPGTFPHAADPPAITAGPVPAPTKGHVLGRVLAPDGTPLVGVLVQGIRYSDLGPGINYFYEEPVLARTNADGRFRLRQLTERYLVRACDAPEDDLQCTDDPAGKRFTPTYAGPDGTTSSWLQQTRFFSPRQPSRSIGTITVKPSAVLEGMFADGANRSVRLLRRNDTMAGRTRTDESGYFRFEVAPGRYRVEADRHEGLRTVATVPGFRSKLLTLTARQPTRLNFQTRPAAIVHGLVSVDGEPAADQFLAFTDSKGRFAAGVVTDGEGRYTVESLRPGRYRLSTSSLFSPFVPQTLTVTASRRSPTRVDVELSRGGLVSFSATDPGGSGDIDAELRDAAGRMVKMYQGNPANEPDGLIAFGGLAPGRYQLVLRRAVHGFSNTEQTDFPWASRTVDIGGAETVALGAIPLDRPTINLTGSIPRGSQVKFTTVPADAFLRESFIDGPNATGIAVNWTEQADRNGRYLSRGLVPGRYAVAVTARYLNPENQPSTYAGNIAVTHHRVTVSTLTPTASFSAPRGGIVKGRMRYARNHRPLIAPVGYEVLDRGDQSWLFPTVSTTQRYAKGFRVDRLHRGRAIGRLLDLQALLDRSEESSTAVPQTLLASARIAEWGTPYWLQSRPRHIRIVPGRVTDVGWVNVRVRR